MTDYQTPPPVYREVDSLPAPPAEIVVTPPSLAEKFAAQGGYDHTFVVKNREDFFMEFRVADFNYFKSESERARARVSELEDTIKEALEDTSVDSDFLESIASIFDISLNREYEFTVTVEFTGTFTLPIGSDPDDVLSNVNWTGESYYNSDVEDFEINDVNMSYTDVQEV